MYVCMRALITYEALITFRYLDEALHIMNTNNSIPAKNDKLQKVFSFDLKEELVILK